MTGAIAFGRNPASMDRSSRFGDPRITDIRVGVARALSGLVTMTTIEDVLSRLRAEFLEMPGMRLTADQVQRLCGVERALCRWALDALVASRFLRVKADGRYARVTDGGDVPRPLHAEAELRLERRIARAS